MYLSAPRWPLALGLGSDRTAWVLLHKLRRATVRPEPECLGGVVEVDEAGEMGIGLIRLRHISNTNRATPHGKRQRWVESRK